MRFLTTIISHSCMRSNHHYRTYLWVVLAWVLEYEVEVPELVLSFSSFFQFSADCFVRPWLKPCHHVPVASRKLLFPQWPSDNKKNIKLFLTSVSHRYMALSFGIPYNTKIRTCTNTMKKPMWTYIGAHVNDTTMVKLYVSHSDCQNNNGEDLFPLSRLNEFVPFQSTTLPDITYFKTCAR